MDNLVQQLNGYIGYHGAFCVLTKNKRSRVTIIYCTRDFSTDEPLIEYYDPIDSAELEDYAEVDKVLRVHKLRKASLGTEKFAKLVTVINKIMKDVGDLEWRDAYSEIAEYAISQDKSNWAFSIDSLGECQCYN